MTTNTLCFAVIGGDTRQLYMTERLRALGYRITCAGFEHASFAGLQRSVSLADALLPADAAVLPLPVSRDDKTVNAAFAERELPLAALTEALRPGIPVFCGMPPEPFRRTLEAKDCPVLDYFKREDLTLRNALLTAEGLLGLLCEKLPVTIAGLCCAVTGYGRVGRCTARALAALGAQVTVFARNAAARAQAEIDHLHTEPLEALPLYAERFDCVINTIPHPVVSEQTLAVSRRDCVFIELASAPYGIDADAAGRCGRRLLRAASLPGKTAPKTAGEIIADTIHKMILEGSA